MGYIRNARRLAILGELILVAGSFVPRIGYIVSFAGTVLVLLGIRGISKATNYFRPYYVYFAGVLVSLAILVILHYNADALKNMSFSGLFVVTWLLIMAGGFIQAFVWLDIKKITGITLFGLAAVLMITGAILYILFVGILLLAIGYLLLIGALFKLPDHIDRYPYNALYRDEIRRQKYWEYK